MSNNTMLGFPNRIDASTLSGGSWSGALPLTNLQNRVLSNFARTTDAALASTKFDINLGAAKNIRLLDFRNHNLSLAAKFRVTASASNTFSTRLYDSGWLLVWPVVFPYGVLEWEDDNWWSGQYTIEQIAGYIPGLTHILPTSKLAQYWRLELSDTTNAAGYLQAGRLFIGPGWQPTINTSQAGTSHAWETKTVVDEAFSGAEYFDRRTPYRVARVSFDWMTEDEAFSNAFEITRRAGIDQEIMYVHNPGDAVHALRRSFLSRLRVLNPIEYPYTEKNKEAFELKELL